MAPGALISAYQQDEGGALRALLPLAGRTVVEYQARCAAAAGAQPILLLVDGIPEGLEQAAERLRQEGIAVTLVRDGGEAAARFDPGSLVLQIADGLAPHMELVLRVANAGEPAIATVRDDEDHAEFERIDGLTRWAGLLLVDARLIGSTAVMLGDWDFQSTLLRRAVQEGALRVPVGSAPSPLLVSKPDQSALFERHLLQASRGARLDWPARFLLPLVEDLATEKLLATRIRPAWLIHAALALTIAAALGFTRGWLWPSLALLLLASPLDQIADRVATLRLRPLPVTMLSRRLLRPAAGLALFGLGWFQALHGGGWGALVAAIAAIAFDAAAAVERPREPVPGEIWLLSPRGAVWTVIPLAIGGWWNAVLALVAAWAAGSFFYLQHLHHRPLAD